jgi:hypothetical protein
MIEDVTFSEAYSEMQKRIAARSKKVHTSRWQGVDISKNPAAATRELLNVDVCVDLEGIEDLDHWRRDCNPNLPWADDHFEERVGGHPLNPGEEWKNWPYAHSADRFRDKDAVFNHTYPERLWPKWARRTPGGVLGISGLIRAVPHRDDGIDARPRYGIAHHYGDLQDLVELLSGEPDTRQAWIPLFFPEDTGKGDGGRKPCTLGYQVIVRDDKAHMYYPLRSCDLRRHWRDDAYLAVRLLLWIIERCRNLSVEWARIVPGTMSMHMTSLHVFENDYLELQRGGTW